MATVFVVIGEAGEYSARQDWVCGVFTNALDAQRMIAERSAIHRQEGEASRLYYKKRAEAGARLFGEGWIFDAEKYNAVTAEVGNAPTETEDGERFYLVEVPLDRWGSYPF